MFGTWRTRLLLDRQQPARAVRLGHAVAFRVPHPVAEQGAAGVERSRSGQLSAQAVPVEDVVTEDQCRGVATDVLGADVERLGQAVGLGLYRVAQRDAQVAAVAEQADELLLLVRRRDDQDVADAGQHQRRQRVVDHRLVVDGQQLLADRVRDRVQPGARATGEDDPFHAWPVAAAVTGSSSNCNATPTSAALAAACDHGLQVVALLAR